MAFTDKTSTKVEQGLDTAAHEHGDKGISSTRNPGTSLPGPVASARIPRLSPFPRGHPNYPLSSGPMPVKGSGQDRFRQVLVDSGYSPISQEMSMGPMPPPFHLPRSHMHSVYAPLHTQAGSQGSPELAPFQNGAVVNPKMYPEVAGFQAPITSLNYPDAAPGAIRYDGPVLSHRVGSHGLPTGQPPGGQFAKKENRAVASKGTPKPTRVTWSAILSAECQKRRFNPSFYEWAVDSGGYRCSVNVDGVTVYDNRTYDTADEAKQAVAKRAVDHVRLKKEVPPGPPNKACDRINDAANKIARMGQTAQKPAPASVMETEKKHLLGQSADMPSLSEMETEKQLVARVRAQFGHLAGSVHMVMDDPVASRAFLVGFAIGCKVRESSFQENAIKAKNARSRAYRERSRVPSSRDRSPRDRPAQGRPSQGHPAQGRLAQGRPARDGPSRDDFTRGGPAPGRSSRGRHSRHPSRDQDRDRRTRTRTRSPVRTQRHSTIF